MGFSWLKSEKNIFNRFYGGKTVFRRLGSVWLVVGGGD